MKKMMHCVEFFGSHDFAWILEPDVKPYLEFRETLTSNKKASTFLRAIEEIDQFVTLSGDTIQNSVAPDSATSDDTKELEQTMQDTEFDALFGGEITTSNFKKNTPKIKHKKDSQNGAGNGTAKKPKKSLKRTQDNGHHTVDDIEAPMPIKKKSTSAVTNFLDRPMFDLERASSPSVDISKTSQKLMDKNIEPSRLNFGFLGLGIMGSGIVKNLLNSGHSVTVWNRTAEKRDEFVKAGAREALTPGDVVAESDITFSCISDPQAVKDMVFGNCGVLSEINTTKGYVEMTGIDPDTSQDIAEAISLKGGRYIEAQIQGSKDQSQDGSLVVLVAGDKSLFEDAHSCFQAMGKYSYHLGEVGNAR
jgi:3-hydroxyisobutyrate dehydrogenase